MSTQFIKQVGNKKWYLHNMGSNSKMCYFSLKKPSKPVSLPEEFKVIVDEKTGLPHVKRK